MLCIYTCITMAQLRKNAATKNAFLSIQKCNVRYAEMFPIISSIRNIKMYLRNYCGWENNLECISLLECKHRNTMMHRLLHFCISNAMRFVS